MDYPPAARDDVVDELFGHRVPDPYRWLEQRDSPATQAWVEAQQELCTGYLAGLPGQERLRARLTELLGSGLVTTPVWRGDRQFLLRREPDQEHAVLLCREADGTQRVLVDPVAIDPTGTTTLDAWQPDKEGRRVAYQLSTGGDEESVLRVLDVSSGDVVDGPIGRTRYSPVAWLPGGEAYFYVRRLPAEDVPDGEDQYHRRVFLHRVGSDPATDVLVWGEGLDKTNYYGVYVNRTGRWFVVTASAGTAPRTDVWLADLQPTGAEQPDLRPVQVGVDAQTSLMVGRDGRLYVLTDRDAPRGRLCVADPEQPGFEHWRDLVAEDDEAVLEHFSLLDGPELGEHPVLLTLHTRHAVSEIVVRDLRSGTPRCTVPLPGLGTVNGLTERPEGGHEAWLAYTDHLTPQRVLRFDATTGEVDVWAEPPGTVTVPTAHARQVVYRSADGTEVRMFVLSREQRPSGPQPAILYGYGGFNVPMTPAYASSILAWVEAGGVYAIANLRGGSEEGEQWHRAGMRANKQNVFDDFIAAAQWLVDEGWTSPQSLAISGGSNGGLLVGATLTQRPDLFAAVHCSAPLLDMVRYEKFGLGESWNDEYGTAADPEELGWLLGYSPYHHVQPRTAYPAVLFTAFDSDTRVDPLHARKMCAALQHATTSQRPVLLRVETEVGHGARSVSRTVSLSADVLAFLAAQTGLALEG